MRQRAEQRVEGDMWIESWPLSRFASWPSNPRAHSDQVSLGESFERHGFIDPIVIDEATQRMVAGHGRIEKLVEMKRDGKPPPGRVRVSPDGEWLVPVLRGVSFANEIEAEAYLISCNRIPEKSGWVEDLLGPMLERHVGNVAGTGYTVEESTDLIARAQRALESSPPNVDPPEDFEEHDVGEKATITCPRCKFIVVSGG